MSHRPSRVTTISGFVKGWSRVCWFISSPVLGVSFKEHALGAAVASDAISVAATGEEYAAIRDADAGTATDTFIW